MGVVRGVRAISGVEVGDGAMMIREFHYFEIRDEEGNLYGYLKILHSTSTTITEMFLIEQLGLGYRVPVAPISKAEAETVIEISEVPVLHLSRKDVRRLEREQRRDNRKKDLFLLGA